MNSTGFMLLLISTLQHSIQCYAHGHDIIVYCVGLTGNLASGKSTVASYFAKLGVDVINADDIAKKLTTSKQHAYYQIISHFGDSVLTATGELNRQYLRQLIFSNSQERLWLEGLLHPLIRKQIAQRIEQVKSPYCIIEIPLLLDRSHYPYLNQVLLIQAEAEQQIMRFMARDNSSREVALAILATQADKNKQRALADDILINTGSLAELQSTVRMLHKKYLDYAMNY